MSRNQIALIAAPLFIAIGLAAFGADSSGKPDAAEARTQLMDADRAFATATAEKGLDGWLSFMADDAVRISPLGGKAAVGKAAIRKLDSGMFADPKRMLVWEPTDAGAFADGKHGFTMGRAKVVSRGEEAKPSGPWAVKYVTMWRKGEDGKWKVILDTGASDAPKP